MAFTVPETEPDTITAGDLWTWTKSLPDYSASDNWTLSYPSRQRAGTQDDHRHRQRHHPHRQPQRLTERRLPDRRSPVAVLHHQQRDERAPHHWARPIHSPAKPRLDVRL